MYAEPQHGCGEEASAPAAFSNRRLRRQNSDHELPHLRRARTLMITTDSAQQYRPQPRSSRVDAANDTTFSSSCCSNAVHTPQFARHSQPAPSSLPTPFHAAAQAPAAALSAASGNHPPPSTTRTLLHSRSLQHLHSNPLHHPEHRQHNTLTLAAFAGLGPAATHALASLPRSRKHFTAPPSRPRSVIPLPSPTLLTSASAPNSASSPFPTSTYTHPPKDTPLSCQLTATLVSRSSFRSPHPDPSPTPKPLPCWLRTDHVSTPDPLPAARGGGPGACWANEEPRPLQDLDLLDLVDENDELGDPVLYRHASTPPAPAPAPATATAGMSFSLTEPAPALLGIWIRHELAAAARPPPPSCWSCSSSDDVPSRACASAACKCMLLASGQQLSHQSSSSRRLKERGVFTEEQQQQQQQQRRQQQGSDARSLSLSSSLLCF